MENRDQPAFPFTTFSNLDQSVPVRYNGMNKRELIAAMVTAELAGSGNEKYFVNDGFLHYESVVKDAIGLTNELLKQLNNS